MFKILDKLKEIKIFEKFFSDNKKTINNFNNCPINIVVGNNLSKTEALTLDEQTQELRISKNLLGDDEGPFNNFLNEFANEKGNRLIEGKTNDLLTKLKNYNSNENQALIEFFKEIISKDDYKILKASNFIIKESSGIDFRELKKGIRNRYGERGNRIVNLLSAGYFNFLKELYNADKEIFKEVYNQMVDEGVTTIFVHNDIDIYKELKAKILKLKTYKLSLNFIHIHGIGDKNIEKIKIFMNENANNKDFIIKNKYEKDKVYMVEIYPN